MRRILHLRSSGGLLGAEAVVLQLAAALPEYGFEVTVGGIFDELDGPPDLLAAARSNGVPCTEIASRGRISVSAIRRLRQIITEGRFDLVHTHGYREDIFAFLAAPMMPKVATNHLWKLTSRSLRAYAALDALVLRRFSKIIAVSRAIASDMASRGLRPSAIQVIENGIAVTALNVEAREAARTRIRHELGLPADAIVLLMVSSLTVEKGHRYAIAAFEDAARAHPRVHLVIAGNGPLESQLKRQAGEVEAGNRIHFLGRREDVRSLLDAADVFVMSSLSEGLPMALLEAMAAGLPAIATDVGEIPLVLTPAVGCLVPSTSTEALSDAMIALAKDAPMRLKLGTAGHRRVVEKYSARWMAERYATVYREVLDAV